jgi:formate C-acetyltransferase
LVEGCIEKARGYYQRGPQYTVFAFHAGGLPDVANALLAIQEVVYKEKRLSLPELVAALRQDWAGQVALRQWIRHNVPFYGNGEPAADEMVRRVFDDFTTLVGDVPERNGVKRPAGLSTFGRQIKWASERGATAAGTHCGEYLSNNFSPAPGTEKNSLTGVIRSFCSVDYMKLPNGTALDIKVHPSSLQGEDGLIALIGVMKSFVELGGWFMHIDVVDSAVLHDAQLHPERYTDLAVRISGWSARFVTLSPEWQEMIIRRTEQEFH